MEELQDYIKAVSLTEDIDWHLAKISTAEKATQGSDRVTRNAGRPKLVPRALRQSLRNGNSPKIQLKHRGQGSVRHQSQILVDTQDAETQIAAAKTAAALNGMARSVDYTQGDTQAASLPLVPPQFTLQEVQIEYNFDSMYHERAPAAVLRTQANELSKEIGGSTRSGQIILCQCGHSKEEGDMVCTCEMR